ncbi:hypothetical protein [Sphingomonas sp. G-3-2-10]|uniref:GTA baseplate fiber-binding domain-containing protein n=1 Tax=Sphingomonas sp. G-3-2-10 TaxID=2728838 RepID=UPI00146A022E|nr:hypothetical protein [Sphingomonas sp. G-3-2-10]NML07908.1 hypothetical protein [Sphingomonas sp. G-3-2-10]
MPPGTGPATLTDRINSIEIELAHAGMVLNDADRAAMDAGANLAMAGEELIQFARAEPLGADRWRLSGLWRGRRGTEAAAGMQAVGDPFVLITAATLAMTDLPGETIGAVARILAEGPGDDEAAEAQAAISGVSIVPPSPVHLSMHPAAEGASEVRWVRRSRAGWRWIDGIDAPLGEESERYRVTISPEDGPMRIVEVSAPAVLVSEAERAAGVLVTVHHIGSHGLSAPAAMLLPALV